MTVHLYRGLDFIAIKVVFFFFEVLYAWICWRLLLVFCVLLNVNWPFCNSVRNNIVRCGFSFIEHYQ